MQEITSEKNFQDQILANFENTKVLIFTSTDVNVSIDFVNAIEESRDEVDTDVVFFVIKEDIPENQVLFYRYNISSVPSSVILNADMTALHTLGDISPADLLIKIEESYKILQTNWDLENSRLNKLFKRKFVDSKFVLFKFARKLKNDEFDKVNEYIDENKQPYVVIIEEEMREEFAFCGLAHLSKFLLGNYNGFREKVPLVAFNKQVFFTLEEIKQFCDNNQQVLNQIRESEEKRINALEVNTPILLFTNSDANLSQNQKDLQDKVMNLLKDKKVMFSYLDVSQQSYIQKRLAEKLNNSHLNYPILKIQDGSYLTADNLEKSINDDLSKIIDSKYIIQSVDDRIRYLLDSNKVIVFIKGTPELPQCGFSRRVVEFMTSKDIKFSHYNILADNELRERLKDYSNWKTYPQVYVNGELIGGNDILIELEGNGQIEDVFGISK